MKYEEYKKLSNNNKMEYHFIKDKKPKLKYKFNLGLIIILLNIILIFQAYLIKVTPYLQHYINSIYDVINLAYNLSLLLISIMVIDSIIYSFKALKYHKMYKEFLEKVKE